MDYRRTFIQSPASDAVFLLGCPVLALAGLMTALHFQWVTLEMFVVFSVIYTGAHHLPGFLRAYGTREIFEANRGRLILAPLLILPLLLYFEMQGQRGYIVVLWFYNWWHTAMQNYGLLRIYERKALPAVRYSVSLDFVSLMVWHFTASEILSPDMRFELAQHLFNLGISDVTTVSLALGALRWTGLIASAVLLVLYVRNSVTQFRTNAVVALNKQLFLFGTYALYFVMFTMVTKDVATSVESFFHNTQYLFFAWIMQRKLAVTDATAFTGVGRLFTIRNGAIALCTYGGAVLLYGYLLGGSIKPRMAMDSLVPVFNVLYAGAAFLHYYTDSFIWKARSREMSTVLGLAGGRGIEMSPRSLGYSLAELSAMILIPITLATALTNPLNTAHASVRENAALAEFSAALLAKDGQWERAAIAASDTGDYFAEKGQTETAQSLYQRAVTARPDYADAHQALGHLHSQAGRPADAAAAYEKAVAFEPSFGSSWNNLGNAYMELGRFNEAEDAYLQAIALDPSSVDARLNAGTLYLRRKDLAKSEAAFRHVLRLRPESPDALSGLGNTAALAGEMDRALDWFQQAVRQDPANAGRHAELARLFMAMQRFDDAIGAWQRAIEIAPEETEFLRELGQVQMSGGRWSDARSTFERCTRLDANAVGCHLGLGEVDLAANRLEDGRKRFETAVAIDGSSADGYWGLARVAARTGTTAVELMYLQQASSRGWEPARQRLSILMAQTGKRD